MKQYSLLQEMNWAKTAHNAIGAIGQSGTAKGALIGSAIGGIKGSRDAKKQGKSSFAGTLKGAIKGATIGSTVGYAAKKLATTDTAKDLQNSLFDKANEIKKNKIAKTAIRDLQRTGGRVVDNAGNYTKDARTAIKNSLAKDRGFGTSVTRHGNTKMFDKGMSAAAEKSALANAQRWARKDSLAAPMHSIKDASTNAAKSFKGMIKGGSVSGF